MALSALMFGSAQAAGGSYDYIKNGADWPESSPDCGLTNQSPIDLSTDSNAYPTYSADEDDFNKVYTNQKVSIPIVWTGGAVTQVAVNKAGQDHQTFNSKIAKEHFGSWPKFTGV